MNALRWILGMSAALFAVAWVGLLVVGDGFRRSFGASSKAVWAMPTGLAIAALVVASCVWPERRALMLVTAGAMMLLGVACVWIMRETTFVGGLGLVYVGLWFWWFLGR